jgi:hypothetical protein
MLLLALVTPASAQFLSSSQMAATDDGKYLYFVSQLLLNGRIPGLSQQL